MANPNFNPTYSTDQIWRGTNENQCLTDDLDTIENDIDTLETNKAAVNHTHDGYASANHSHTGYAAADHAHSYNDLTDKPTIPTIPSSLPANGGNADTVDGKHASEFAGASHTHSDYAAASHTHSGYAVSDHTHTEYAVSGHSHSYNDLSDKPTIPSIPASLPADGGNADTVDNKHAADFASADHTHIIYGGNGASTYKKVWIATTGSDDNAGTSAAPMATITGAIRKYSHMYKMLDISLADGTYTENIGAISPALTNLAIRSNSEDKDKVTINMTTSLEVNVNILRLYNITLAVADTGVRPISLTGGNLYAYNVRINVPEASGSSCVNVYNGCSAFMMHCVLNAGTATGSGAAVYGNQALHITAIACTSERTIGTGFYAHNGTYIEYTATVTATTMTRTSYYGKCVAR